MPKGQLGSNRTKKQISTQSEKRLAEDLDGRRITGSGCTDSAKGDVKARGYLIELKETTNKSIIVSQTVLSKISREAREAGKVPALAIQFERTPLGVSNRWVAVPLDEFKRLTGEE